MMVWPGIPEITLIMAPSAVALGQIIVQPPVIEESLSEKVTNPVEPLMRITAENAYSPSLWKARGDENEVKGVFVVPFKAFAAQNLARIKIFFDASASDGTHGLSELQLFDLLLFQHRVWLSNREGRVEPHRNPPLHERVLPGGLKPNVVIL